MLFFLVSFLMAVRNSLFLTSFWKDLLLNMEFRLTFSFFLTAWLMLLHCHLIDIFSGKKILISFLSWFPVYIFFPFPLAAFKVFSFTTGFEQCYMVCLDIVFLVLGIYGSSWIYAFIIFVIAFENFAYCSPNIFFCH